ncbi:MAG: hypothetical protein MMC33_004455 [Icmadophila ericetorum]|nr:hypothetical protein [Icmadophila ericetorum]
MASSSHLKPTDPTKIPEGVLYHAFIPELVRARERCQLAYHKFNAAGPVSRRRAVELWRDIINDKTPLPPPLPNQEEDDAQFQSTDPLVLPPIFIDYGVNTHISPGAFINGSSTFLDTCAIHIGARTLVGPNVSFYAGTHPLDPEIRQGIDGPELGYEIWVGEDCWFGGGAIVLPGVKIGKGAVVGAGSVVTKDVPPFTVVAGNPARILRKIKTGMDPEQQAGEEGDKMVPPEALMAKLAVVEEEKVVKI